MLPKARSRHGEGNVDGAMGPRPRSCHDKLRAAMAGRVIEGVQPKRVAVPGCSGRQLWVVEVDLAVETARLRSGTTGPPNPLSAEATVELHCARIRTCSRRALLRRTCRGRRGCVRAPRPPGARPGLGPVWPRGGST